MILVCGLFGATLGLWGFEGLKAFTQPFYQAGLADHVREHVVRENRLTEEQSRDTAVTVSLDTKVGATDVTVCIGPKGEDGAVFATGLAQCSTKVARETDAYMTEIATAALDAADAIQFVVIDYE